jgi:hypothetical protein
MEGKVFKTRAGLINLKKLPKQFYQITALNIPLIQSNRKFQWIFFACS